VNEFLQTVCGDVRELIPWLPRYTCSLAYLAAQLVVVRRWRLMACVRFPRGASDPTWFVASYLWGVESILHLHVFLFGPSRYCFGRPLAAFGLHGTFSWGLGALVLGGCFLSEHWARQRGWPVRSAQGTLPLGTVAALLSVQATWALHLVVFIPFPRS
jgi:hypothetical protein